MMNQFNINFGLMNLNSESNRENQSKRSNFFVSHNSNKLNAVIFDKTNEFKDKTIDQNKKAQTI